MSTPQILTMLCFRLISFQDLKPKKHPNMFQFKDQFNRQNLEHGSSSCYLQLNVGAVNRRFLGNRSLSWRKWATTCWALHLYIHPSLYASRVEYMLTWCYHTIINTVSEINRGHADYAVTTSVYIMIESSVVAVFLR